MSNFAHVSRFARRTVSTAVCVLALGLVVPSWAATTGVEEKASAADIVAASALLAVDRNRPTIVERIVNEWGEKLANFGAGVGREQLREMLFAMRADQLLAASLAGSLEGLKSIVVAAAATRETAAAQTKKAAVEPAALGDPNADLVYTPVTPCRLFDTRPSQGGAGTPVAGVRRAVGARVPVANQGGPGGCAVSSTATVALVLIGTLTPSGAGYLQGGPQGAASFPNALITYQQNDQYGATVAIPLNPANGQFELVEVFGTADLYGDLLGYFSPPAATAVQCTQVTGPSTTIATSADTLVALPSCAAGYTRTGTNCSGPANVPSGYLVETNATGCLFRNLSAVATFNATASSTCCRVPGN